MATVYVPAGGARLAGELMTPEDARGLVLFAHGSGSSRFSSRNQFVARVLEHRGLATLLIDLLTPEEERLDERTAQAEANLGPIDAWNYEGLAARREAPENVAGIPETIRRIVESGAPAFAAAVSSIGFEEREIVVRFRRPDDLRPKLVEGRSVECLLY